VVWRARGLACGYYRHVDVQPASMAWHGWAPLGWAALTGLVGVAVCFYVGASLRLQEQSEGFRYYLVRAPPPVGWLRLESRRLHASKLPAVAPALQANNVVPCAHTTHVGPSLTPNCRSARFHLAGFRVGTHHAAWQR
jgi:hypothetical protein